MLFAHKRLIFSVYEENSNRSAAGSQFWPFFLSLQLNASCFGWEISTMLISAENITFVNDELFFAIIQYSSGATLLHIFSEFAVSQQVVINSVTSFISTQIMHT